MAHPITHVTVRNGLTLAYVVALVNASLALLDAFGLHLNNAQQVAIVGFVNAAVLVGARVLHLPERTPAGGTVTVQHVPVLTTTAPNGDTSTLVPATPAPATEPVTLHTEQTGTG